MYIYNGIIFISIIFISMEKMGRIQVIFIKNLFKVVGANVVR